MSEKPKSDKKAPGFWFYPADYERDMQILSLASQGLWSRMLCWMSDNEAHRGFAELPTGIPMTLADVASRVGKPAREVEKCLDEMLRVGVYSLDDRGCIFCRRMARDTHISEVRRAAAKSRHETEKRAAGGKFCSDFDGAKEPAKRMQKPTVTVPVSVPVSDSVLPTYVASRGGNALALEWPETALAIRQHFPATDDALVISVVHEAAREFVEAGGGGLGITLSDSLLAQAVVESYFPRQESAGIFRTRVPRTVKSWVEEANRQKGISCEQDAR